MTRRSKSDVKKTQRNPSLSSALLAKAAEERRRWQDEMNTAAENYITEFSCFVFKKDMPLRQLCITLVS